MSRRLNLAEVLRLHELIIASSGGSSAALESLLMLNGHELDVSVDEAEAEILAVAAGDRSREEFTSWVSEHVRRLPT